MFKRICLFMLLSFCLCVPAVYAEDAQATPAPSATAAPSADDDLKDSAGGLWDTVKDFGSNVDSVKDNLNGTPDKMHGVLNEQWPNFIKAATAWIPQEFWFIALMIITDALALAVYHHLGR